MKRREKCPMLISSNAKRLLPRHGASCHDDWRRNVWQPYLVSSSWIEFFSLQLSEAAIDFYRVTAISNGKEHKIVSREIAECWAWHSFSRTCDSICVSTNNISHLLILLHLCFSLFAEKILSQTEKQRYDGYYNNLAHPEWGAVGEYKQTKLDTTSQTEEEKNGNLFNWRHIPTAHKRHLRAEAIVKRAWEILARPWECRALLRSLQTELEFFSVASSPRMAFVLNLASFHVINWQQN